MVELRNKNILLCPVCDSEYMHPTSTHIENGDVFLELWCEECGEGHPRTLEISHRKGHTLFRWVL